MGRAVWDVQKGTVGHRRWGQKDRRTKSYSWTDGCGVGGISEGITSQVESDVNQRTKV